MFLRVLLQSLKSIVDLEDSDNQEVSALILKLVNAASKAIKGRNKLFRIADKSSEAGWAAVDEDLTIGEQGWRSGESASFPPMPSWVRFPDPASYVG